MIFEDGDLKFKDGDFAIENSDEQGIEFILRARPGHFYQFPTLGIGIDSKKMASINKQQTKQQIKRQLTDDGYRVNKIFVGGGIDDVLIEVDATKVK